MQAEEVSKEILEKFGNCALAANSALKTLEVKVFGTGKEEGLGGDSPLFFNKPFVLMGMVKNTGSDTGGAPVLAEISGKKVKICIEGPHVSEIDAKQFLAKEGTYFNPVFVATEVPTSCFFAKGLEGPFPNSCPQVLRRSTVHSPGISSL